jgi:NADH:ubiquinone oxidoreductase subunit
MTIGTILFTLLKGRLVGRDGQGNRYFEERGGKAAGRRRRWVMYKGAAEASRVPPEWHAWLHRTVDAPPTESKRPARAWQKPHIPNLTGTTEAWRPPGHEYEGGRRSKATGDYEPWRPN